MQKYTLQIMYGSFYHFLVGRIGILEDVHVRRKGDVLHHDEHVGHGHPRQQQVDRVTAHVLKNIFVNAVKIKLS